jgi:hypothetical protein
MSSFISRLVGLSEPAVPRQRLERINQILRRRLDDSVADVFDRACLHGDLDTASELLEVLRNMHARRQVRAGPERRTSDEAIRRASADLARRKLAQRSARPHDRG